MPPPTPPVAQARTSCQRCHKRKKRCDRKLPQCDNCRAALVACSFVDDDRQLGSYPIAFVQGLEARVQELERQLADLRAMSPSSPADLDVETGDDRRSPRDPAWDQPGMAPPPGMMPPQPPAPSPSLADELRALSLEATAERHLGAASGVSFAKLTQTVLRRLTPDKADFIFENVLEDGVQEAVAPTSPRGALAAAFSQLPASPAPFPQPLFGPIALSDITDTDVSLAALPLPDAAHMRHLADFYFAHTHTLYPIVPRAEFADVVACIRADPAGPLAQSPLSRFRLWMVLAIGSTTYSSVTLAEESESVLYYSKALEYLEAALGYGDLAALEVIMLQVCYSFFNQLGPNTWFLVGLAARLAMGIGLHSASTYEGFPYGLVQRRKRLFFSIYMMDRVVSIALGRPFALHDDDIDVEPFDDVDDEDTDAHGPRPRDPFKPSLMAVPLHILRLRRIASKTARLVYGNRRATAEVPEGEAVIQELHQELIDWRRAMPFPLPDPHPQVPHLSSGWFDLNYHTHLALLYRPSPLLPQPSGARVAVLAAAAAGALRQAAALHRQRRFAYNWLNLLAVYTATLALVYATTTRPDSLPRVLADSQAIDDLGLAVELFATLAAKFTVARKTQRMVEDILARYEYLRNSAT